MTIILNRTMSRTLTNVNLNQESVTPIWVSPSK